MLNSSLTPFTYMMVWLISLLIGFLSYNPCSYFSMLYAPHQDIISPSAITWLKDIRTKYDIPGISLGVIASPSFTASGWKNQTFHTGNLLNGKAVDDDVSTTIALD
jgi:hypothetical protein